MGANMTKDKLRKLVENDDAKHIAKALEADPAVATTTYPELYDASVLHFAARNNAVKVMKLLIDAGANVNALDERGLSPLHEAARNGQPGPIKMLLEAGADASACRGEDGTTPLMDVLKYAGMLEGTKEEWDLLDARAESIDVFLAHYAEHDELDINQVAKPSTSAALDWTMGKTSALDDPAGQAREAEWLASIHAKIAAAGGVLADPEFFENLAAVRALQEDAA
ncbi:uncharacterized protein AMSG_01713 [Thecamonas trahens ATCC 50062]|uniref:Uncharacterized protein n=1 Tax=Thecamonas trahens ATCC 50062 TaxID=461836 RepID=A0A0L0DRB7_THETB|nr:hypothetical protein AMSG_01713 [Thecamonas trahens ATCC 50062]KNC54859.1 hypothetical protein AMSG_01713 [Thecamonas trahens ATCC 50062]|eukprot:XP_013761756.1 hypothetical protein AMSG_01713 [Thecamonas trahens ATCC 50062]